MAFTLFQELFDARTAKYDDTGHREYTRTFIVVTDNSATDAAAVVLSPLFPRLYTPYIVPAGTDLGALLKSKEAHPDPETPYKWTVILTYSTKVGNPSRHPGNPDPSDPSGFSNSPLDRPPLITWDAVQFTRPAINTIDPFSPPIMNSANLPYVPPPEIDDSRPTLRIERNQASFDQSLAQKYRDAINSDSFFGFDPGTVKVQKIGASLEFEKGIYYWRTVYVFQMRPETWTLKLLDASFYEFAPADNTQWVRINDKFANPCTIPFPLDGNGHKLPANGTPVIKSYNVYNSLPFAVLSLP